MNRSWSCRKYSNRDRKNKYITRVIKLNICHLLSARLASNVLRRVSCRETPRGKNILLNFQEQQVVFIII